MKDRKTNLSVSFSLRMIVKIDDYVEKYGGTFSEFVRDACAYKLDDNPTVTNDSIQDSEPLPIKQPIESKPNNKNNFNFDDIE